MKVYPVKLRLLVIFLLVVPFGTVAAEELGVVEIVVETEIDSPDPQAGMKSRQSILVDFGAGTAESSFETGVTTIGALELSSIRDEFEVRNAIVTGRSATLTVVGETASGTVILPNINYEFAFVVSAKGQGHFSGCHDGYPSYEILVDGKSVYKHKHDQMAIQKLFGHCDIRVASTELQ